MAISPWPSENSPLAPSALLKRCDTEEGGRNSSESRRRRQVQAMPALLPGHLLRYCNHASRACTGRYPCHQFTDTSCSCSRREVHGIRGATATSGEHMPRHGELQATQTSRSGKLRPCCYALLAAGSSTYATTLQI